MEQRLRSRATEEVGYHFDRGVPYAQDSRADHYEFFDDLIKTYGIRNKACSHVVTDVKGSYVSYSQLGGRLTGENLPSVFHESFINYEHPFSFDESDLALWTRHLAGSAPDREDVNVLAFFGEMLPGALKRVRRGMGLGFFAEREKARAKSRKKPPPPYGEVGAAFDRQYPSAATDTLVERAKQVADDYLSYSFGAAPFIGDAIKLAQLAKAFAKRKKELENAATSAGSKKKWTIGTGNNTADYSYDYRPLGRYPANFTGTIKVTMTAERAAYSTWRPRLQSTIPATDGAIVNALTGLTVKGVGLALWELTPWSWLLDYFTTFGNFLEASANVLQWEVEGGIIYKITTHGTHTPMREDFGPGDWKSVSGGVYERKLFKRIPMYALPSITWARPFLDGHQLSILSALTATRV